MKLTYALRAFVLVHEASRAIAIDINNVKAYEDKATYGSVKDHIKRDKTKMLRGLAGPGNGQGTGPGTYIVTFTGEEGSLLEEASSMYMIRY